VEHALEALAVDALFLDEGTRTGQVAQFPVVPVDGVEDPAVQLVEHAQFPFGVEQARVEAAAVVEHHRHAPEDDILRQLPLPLLHDTVKGVAVRATVEEELDHVNAAILGMRHRRFERLVMLAGQIAQRLRRHRQAQTDQYQHGQSANTGQSPHAVSEPWSQNAGAGHQMRPDSTSTVVPACASLTSSASSAASASSADSASASASSSAAASASASAASSESSAADSSLSDSSSVSAVSSCSSPSSAASSAASPSSSASAAAASSDSSAFDSASASAASSCSSPSSAASSAASPSSSASAAAASSDSSASDSASASAA